MTIYDLGKDRKNFFNAIDKHVFCMLYLKVDIAIITCKNQTDYISNPKRWRGETPAGADCYAIGFSLDIKNRIAVPMGYHPPGEVCQNLARASAPKEGNIAVQFRGRNDIGGER